MSALNLLLKESSNKGGNSNLPIPMSDIVNERINDKQNKNTFYYNFAQKNKKQPIDEKHLMSVYKQPAHREREAETVEAELVPEQSTSLVKQKGGALTSVKQKGGALAKITKNEEIAPAEKSFFNKHWGKMAMGAGVAGAGAYLYEKNKKKNEER